MEKINNYLIGGKLGDFIHCLLLPAFRYHKIGIKANIYLDDSGGWERDFKSTYSDLLVLLCGQEYFYDLKPYNGEKIDYDLRKFRQSNLLYRASWTEIILKPDGWDETRLDKNFKWLSTLKFPDFEDVILINRSNKPWNERLEKEYNDILDNNECRFVTSDYTQYDNFPLKHKLKAEVFPGIVGLATAINSCKQYIGNQSAPSAIAMALGVKRKIELLDLIDRVHYLGESKFNSPDKLTFF